MGMTYAQKLLAKATGATQAAVAQVAQLQSVVSEQSRQIALLMTKLSETNDLLLRRAVNG